MKKLIKYFSVYFTAVLLLVSCICFPSLGVFASSADSYAFTLAKEFESPTYLTVSGDESGDGSYSGSLFIYGIFDALLESVPVEPGTYSISGSPYLTNAPFVPALQILVAGISDNSDYFKTYNFGEVFVVPDTEPCSITCQSFSQPVISVYEESEPLYQTAWNLFVKYVYGEGAELTPEQTLTLTVLSTLAVLAVVLIPFIIVFIPLWLIFRR